MNEIKYRWVDGVSCTQEEWDKIDMMLATRGWMSLNRNTTRALIAESPEGVILGFNIFQMIPFLGPLYVLPSARGTGVAEDLSQRMVDFMTEVEARGFIAVAQSPHAAKLCEHMGMKKVESPVYAKGGL
jgi:GNAT superfamily N-acetyltransferase